VLSRAVVRDLCSRAEGARVLSFVGMGMGAIPLAVPTINAQVGVMFGWRATLVVYVVYLAVTLWMTLAWFRETLETPDPRALSPGDFGRAVGLMLRHPQALGYMLCCVFGYGGLAVWISSAPHLLLEHYAQPAGRFGFWWAIPVVMYVTGGFLSARGLRFYSSDTMLRAGTVVLLIAGAALVLQQGSGRVSLNPFIAAVAAYHLGWAIVQPHAQAGALSFFPSLAGRASALLGFLQMLGGATIGLVFGYFHDGTPRAAVYLIALMALAATVARVALASRPKIETRGIDP
jgi:DHA1 family bicyclomycin/chloramphenicol resistance-like MFS transporter